MNVLTILHMLERVQHQVGLRVHRNKSNRLLMVFQTTVHRPLMTTADMMIMHMIIDENDLLGDKRDST